MLNDLALFDVDERGRVRVSDPATSVIAARSADRHEALVAEIHAAHPDGLTDDELCAYVDVDVCEGSVKSARSRLAKRGDLVATGLTRLSRRRRPMIVWRVA